MQLELRRAEFEPAFQRVGAAQRVGGEFRPGRVGPVLLQPEAAEIVMRLHQIAVELQRGLIRLRGVRRLPGVLQRDAVIIPRRRVRGQQRRGGLQLRRRAGVIAAVQQFFSGPQRARSRRRAAGDKNGERQEKQKTKMADGGWRMANSTTPGNSIFHQPASTLEFIFNGQHRRWCYHPCPEVSRNGQIGFGDDGPSAKPESGPLGSRVHRERRRPGGVFFHSSPGNPPAGRRRARCALAWTVAAVCFAALQMRAAGGFWIRSTNETSRVVIVENTNAVLDFQPDAAVVRNMVNHGLTTLTGKAAIADAWRSLVTTNDVVGIKVFSEPGEISGTRPAVVAAVIHGLLDAGMPANHIIIWDKHTDDLRAAGFSRLAAQLGVRVAGAADAGYDPTNFYNPDTPIIGTLVWGDFEFGKKGEGVGRRSFVSELVSHDLTKIINIVPLLNDNAIGVCGHLYSLAMASVDNTYRFEGYPDRLAVAVPDIYALPSVGDLVVLNITDALIAQYEGGERGLLQYSCVPDQLWFSLDPVALDTLAVRELDRERRATKGPEFTPHLDIYTNAVLLRLGVSDPAKMRVEKIQ